MIRGLLSIMALAVGVFVLLGILGVFGQSNTSASPAKPTAAVVTVPTAPPTALPTARATSTTIARSAPQRTVLPTSVVPVPLVVTSAGDEGVSLRLLPGAGELQLKV